MTRNVAPESTGQQDLRTYLRILWRWKLLFLAFVVLIPLGVYLVERSKPKVYRSSTLIELQDVSAQGVGTTGGPIVSGNLAAVARLVTTTPVADTAARLLHQAPGSLSNEVSASADTTTGFLTITAKDHDPARAAAIANAFAAALANHQAAQARSVIEEQIRSLQTQLAALPRSNAGSRVTLTQQIAQLQALSGSTSSGATVIQAAVPSSTPVSPKTRRAVELALVIAVLLGIGAVFLAENADRRLRTPEDIENLTGWPLLAAIPPSAFSPEHLADPHNEEAFQMLGSSLAYFNVEQPIGSVAIVSPQVGDGKTTVAAGLAVANALAGKRAILIDGDLRRPQVSGRLGTAEGAGLGAALAGEKRVDEVMSEYPLDAPEAGRLLVFGAGPAPPNPAALLRSAQMGALVKELETQADLVVIDTVAALAVGDALSLLKAVSGIVVVVRMNRTSRASVRRLQKMIASADGKVLGAVATGSGAVARGYGVYPYADGHARGAFRVRRPRRFRSPITVNHASSNGAASSADADPPADRAGAEAERGLGDQQSS